MRYRVTRNALAILLLLGSAITFGQDSASNILDNEDLANARALLQAGRADIIREELRLTAEESAGFWPVYDKYHNALGVVRDRKAQMVAEFLEAYRAGTTGNEYAEEMIKEHFEIKSDLLKIQKKFLRQFRKVLPELKVARFYQLESKMDAELEAQLALFVPLVEAM
jgi:hypothetical protein